jgi:hypothetical protein
MERCSLRDIILISQNCGNLVQMVIGRGSSANIMSDYGLDDRGSLSGSGK